ncbi:MAG: ATPase [Acidobacteria bacterium]|jgi:DNA-binding transcriptional ArsR family regulator/nucleoside-triphosphatase THEP1|nr:ATPase [Acidobacteriota bacterium]
MLPANTLSHIYNPLNQTEEEALKNFVVRQKEFHSIFNDIKGSTMVHPEPHYIIQGQRGQGKTTLLLKLYYEIRRDEQLNRFIIPIIFKEEQYHIGSLFDLWAHTAEILEEEDPGFVGLYEAIDAVYDSRDAELEAFKMLENALREKKKKLVLLLDNIGQLLAKLEEREHHRLREILLTCAEIRIIGASAVVLEYTFDYSKPFYELFRIITLEGLTEPDTITLLLNLGEHYGQESIKRIVANEPGRIETLRRLTAGVPRTIILLFEIFVDHENGSAFQDLEFVLDRVSPLYKHRMDDLSPQQQKIVDAIAMNWDAMGVKEIAVKTRLESKAVSSHLKLLEKNRIIHKVKTSTKNYYYQVTERFFNIWYLMRYGKRRGKNRVQWLVNFLQDWCSREELIARLYVNEYKNYKKAEEYYRMAVEKGHTEAMNNLALFYLTQKKNKAKALALINEAVKNEKDFFILETFTLVLLWNNEIEEALKVGKELLESKDFFDNYPSNCKDYFFMLMAKKQYYAALKLFEESPFELKDRLKPVYYALMYFLKDDYPNEFIKMGDELKQTVEEIIEVVRQWEKDYA